LAYSDTVGDNAYLLKRTLRGIGDFAGRSRRTEVIYYWIVTLLIGVVVGFAGVVFLPIRPLMWFDVLLQLILVVPMFALFVRRLHDQNRSGLWGLLLPLALVLSIPERLTEFRGDPVAIIAQKTSSTAIVLDVISIAILVLFLWPGTDGPNHFGPDPRLQEE
jgi:uncharacterized membrane protein YhaH (DUF805 family)